MHAILVVKVTFYGLLLVPVLLQFVFVLYKVYGDFDASVQLRGYGWFRGPTLQGARSMSSIESRSNRSEMTETDLSRRTESNKERSTDQPCTSLKLKASQSEDSFLPCSPRARQRAVRRGSVSERPYCCGMGRLSFFVLVTDSSILGCTLCTLLGCLLFFLVHLSVIGCGSGVITAAVLYQSGKGIVYSIFLSRIENIFTDTPFAYPSWMLRSLMMANLIGTLSICTASVMTIESESRTTQGLTQCIPRVHSLIGISATLFDIVYSLLSMHMFTSPLRKIYAMEVEMDVEQASMMSHTLTPLPLDRPSSAIRASEDIVKPRSQLTPMERSSPVSPVFFADPSITPAMTPAATPNAEDDSPGTVNAFITPDFFQLGGQRDGTPVSDAHSQGTPSAASFARLSDRNSEAVSQTHSEVVLENGHSRQTTLDMIHEVEVKQAAIAEAAADARRMRAIREARKKAKQNSQMRRVAVKCRLLTSTAVCSTFVNLIALVALDFGDLVVLDMMVSNVSVIFMTSWLDQYYHRVCCLPIRIEEWIKQGLSRLRGGNDYKVSPSPPES